LKEEAVRFLREFIQALISKDSIAFTNIAESSKVAFRLLTTSYSFSLIEQKNFLVQFISSYETNISFENIGMFPFIFAFGALQ